MKNHEKIEKIIWIQMKLIPSCRSPEDASIGSGESFWFEIIMEIIPVHWHWEDFVAWPLVVGRSDGHPCSNGPLLQQRPLLQRLCDSNGCCDNGRHSSNSRFCQTVVARATAVAAVIVATTTVAATATGGADCSSPLQVSGAVTRLAVYRAATHLEEKWPKESILAENL